MNRVNYAVVRDFNMLWEYFKKGKEDVFGLTTPKSSWQRGTDGIWEKEGKRFSVEVTYGFEERTPRLVVLKEEAKKAGIELLLQQIDPTAVFKKFLEKNFDVAWMGWSTSLRPQYWEHFHSINAHKPQTNNVTNTDDPEMDKLIDAYRNSLDEKERIRLSLDIQQKIHDIGMFVPTFMVPYVREVCWRWWRLPEPPGTGRRIPVAFLTPLTAQRGACSGTIKSFMTKHSKP